MATSLTGLNKLICLELSTMSGPEFVQESRSCHWFPVAALLLHLQYAGVVTMVTCCAHDGTGLWGFSRATEWKGTLGTSLFSWGKPGFRRAPFPVTLLPHFLLHALSLAWFHTGAAKTLTPALALTSYPDFRLLPSPACSRMYPLTALVCPGLLRFGVGYSQGPRHSVRGRVGGMEP